MTTEKTLDGGTLENAQVTQSSEPEPVLGVDDLTFRIGQECVVSLERGKRLEQAQRAAFEAVRKAAEAGQRSAEAEADRNKARDEAALWKKSHDAMQFKFNAMGEELAALKKEHKATCDAAAVQAALLAAERERATALERALSAAKGTITRMKKRK